MDLSTEFDIVRQDQLMKLLKGKNIVSRDINIVSDLHYDQIAVVKIDQKTTIAIQGVFDLNVYFNCFSIST